MTQPTIPAPPVRIPRCSRTLASLIAMGVRGAASYEPTHALAAVGVHMSDDERAATTSFLHWLVLHGRTVDRMTVQAVWQEWKEEWERGRPGFASQLSPQTQNRIARGVQKHCASPTVVRDGQQLQILQVQMAGGVAHG